MAYELNFAKQKYLNAMRPYSWINVCPYKYCSDSVLLESRSHKQAHVSNIDSEW